MKIEGLAYEDISEEVEKTLHIHTLDHPISSAIACALVKATGIPIIVEKEEASRGRKIIDLEYRLLEESVQ